MPGAYPPRPVVITFLTDYGLEDDFVGVCHAVMARDRARTYGSSTSRTASRATTCGPARWCCAARCPSRRPACTSRSSTRRSAGAGARSRCAARTRTGCSSGRTTGCSCPRPSSFGGVVEAVEISGSPHRLRPVSATFHGRDLFAPVAAALAGGASLLEAGSPVDPDELVPLSLPEARVEDGELVAHALAHRPVRQRHARRDARPALRRRAAARAPGRRRSRRRGARRAVRDDVRGRRARRACCSTRTRTATLALAVNRGSAADRMGLSRDDELRLRPAGP